MLEVFLSSSRRDNSIRAHNDKRVINRRVICKSFTCCLPEEREISSIILTRSLMATAVASSISSTTSRRLHYQSQLSNASTSSHLPNGDTSHSNESLSFSRIHGNPLITIVYSKTSLSQGILIREISKNFIWHCACVYTLGRSKSSYVLLEKRRKKRIGEKMICK